MKRCLVFFVVVILSTITLLGCSAFRLPFQRRPTPTPDQGPLQTRIAQAVAATLSAIPSPTPVQPTNTPSPVSPKATDIRVPTVVITPTLATPNRISTPSPSPSPTSRFGRATSTSTPTRRVTATSTPATPQSPTLAAPKSSKSPNAVYALKEERTIGNYVIRLWQNTARGASRFEDLVTISAPGQRQVQVESVSQINPLTGKDITGEGNPDVVIDSYTGGAHCCFVTTVYDLGPTLLKVLETRESNCSGKFEDLDGDGALEFITCDDLFAYQYCCYAGTPTVKVIFKYEAGKGYRPASPRFAQQYAADIAAHTELAKNAKPEDHCEWDKTNKCAVLPLVLDYLYSGAPAKAWEALALYYKYPDAAKFRAEIERRVSQSPYYTK